MNDTEQQKSSDDEMIDIQIEESLVRESLMAIDSNNFKEDVLNLAGFASILFLMMLVGIYGPPALLSQSSSQIFSSDLSLYFSSEGLSSYNRFASYDILFTRSDAKKPINSWASFQYSIESSIDQKVVHRSYEKLSNTSIVFAPGEYNSRPFHIYRDRIIDFSKIEFTIRIINSEGISDATFNTTVTVYCGSPEHTLFQIILRAIFSLFVAFFLISFWRNLRTNPIKLWHLEQKLTVPLLVLGFLYNNPFYIIQATRPTYIYILWDTIISSIFWAYFHFFILVLFDSLRYKNRKTDNCFFAPKIIYILIMFLVTVVHGIYDDITSFHNTPNIRFDQVELILRWTQISLYFIYLVWAIVTIVLSGLQIDVIEKYKFYMYLSTGGTALFVLGLVHVLFSAFSLFKNSAIHFVMSFAVENSFILMMMYFHWPYEVINYGEDNSIEQAPMEPNDFFANEQADGNNKKSNNSL